MALSPLTVMRARLSTGAMTISPFQREFARTVGKAREFRADETDADLHTVLHHPFPVRVDKRGRARGHATVRIIAGAIECLIRTP